MATTITPSAPAAGMIDFHHHVGSPNWADPRTACSPVTNASRAESNPARNMIANPVSTSRFAMTAHVRRSGPESLS